MVLFFEIWAQVSYSSSFVFNGFNVQSILIFATAPLLLGIGQSLVIISGGIDLSVGFIMGLSAVVLATIVQSFSGEAQGVALAIGILATCLVCLIPGLINGLLITKLKVPPFIGTLGMYGVARGSGFIIADGMTVPVDNDWLYNLGTGKILGIPIIVLIVIIVALVFHFVLSRTKFGQYTYAIGERWEAYGQTGMPGNPQAAVDWHVLKSMFGLGDDAPVKEDDFVKAFLTDQVENEIFQDAVAHFQAVGTLSAIPGPAATIYEWD